MINRAWFKHITVMIMSISLTFQLAACGTVFYPERKGQINGQIDPKVAAGDAIGLLFFIVPGVVAFAFDFSNGTIYLPNGKRAILNDEQRKNLIADGEVNLQQMQAVLKQTAAIDANLQVSTLRIEPMYSIDQVQARFEHITPLLAKI